MKPLTIPLAGLFLVAPVLAYQIVRLDVSISDDRQHIEVTLENYDDIDQSCTIIASAVAGVNSQDVTTTHLFAQQFDVPANEVKTFKFETDQLARSIPGFSYKSADGSIQSCARIPVSTFVREIGIPGQKVSFVDLLEQPDGALITLTWQSGGCVGAGVSPQGFAVQKLDRTGRVIWRNELCNFPPEEANFPPEMKLPPARLLPTASGGVTLVTVVNSPRFQRPTVWCRHRTLWIYGLQKLDIDAQGHAGSAEHIAIDSTRITALHATGEVGRFRTANMYATCEHEACFESTVYSTDGSQGPTIALEYKIVAQNGLPDVPALSDARATPLNDGSFLVGGKPLNAWTYYLKRHAQDGALIWAREVKYPRGIGLFACSIPRTATPSGRLISTSSSTPRASRARASRGTARCSSAARWAPAGS